MIVSSQIVESVPQVDGRISVREIHIDQFGTQHPVSYLAEQGSDLNGLLVQHADALNVGVLRDKEIRRLTAYILAGNDPLTFTFEDCTSAYGLWMLMDVIADSPLSIQQQVAPVVAAMNPEDFALKAEISLEMANSILYWASAVMDTTTPSATVAAMTAQIREALQNNG